MRAIPKKWLIASVAMVTILVVGTLGLMIPRIAKADIDPGKSRVIHLCLDYADGSIRVVKWWTGCNNGEVRRLVPRGNRLNADTLDGLDSTEFDPAGAGSGGSFNLDNMETYFVTSGAVVLTQPEFIVAGFNQVIEEVNLNLDFPVNGTSTDTFDPVVLVSMRTGAPVGLIGTEYRGVVSWKHVVYNYPPIASTPRGIEHRLQFFLETQPQPPQPNGDPAPGDTAPAGSQVEVNYRAVFVRYGP